MSKATILTPSISIGSVTQRTIGSNRNSKTTVFDHIVGILPNGKPLNVMTHGENIKVILPSQSGARTTRDLTKSSPRKF